jgi:N-methylhydantoinase B/oxoprolinase/acetone carboxylase alpha subunit
VPNETLFTLLGENVRNPEQVLGDIHVLITANALGAERLVAFMDEYGMHDLTALAAVVQDRRRGGDARGDPRGARRRLREHDLRTTRWASGAALSG